MTIDIVGVNNKSHTVHGAATPEVLPVLLMDGPVRDILRCLIQKTLN